MNKYPKKNRLRRRQRKTVHKLNDKNMRFTNVVMWSFLTTFFILYLIAIRLVRGQFLLSSSTSSEQKFVDFNYHNHESMETIMRTFAQTYPKLCKLYSIGKSVQGNLLTNNDLNQFIDY